MLKLLKLSTSIVKIVLKTKMCVCVCVCVCERVHVVDALSFHHQKWQNGVEDMMKSTEFLVFFPVCPPPPCDVQVLHTFLFKASHPRPTPPCVPPAQTGTQALTRPPTHLLPPAHPPAYPPTRLPAYPPPCLHTDIPTYPPGERERKARKK